MNEVNLNDLGVEVLLENEDDFLKVKETLTRIGIPSHKEKVLYPSCNILHKKGKYYITHFKSLFLLDGRTADITENDLARRNTISLLLEDWGLVKVVDRNRYESNVVNMNQIKILTFKEKSDWTISPKYQIGSKKRNYNV